MNRYDPVPEPECVEVRPADLEPDQAVWIVEDRWFHVTATYPLVVGGEALVSYLDATVTSAFRATDTVLVACSLDEALAWNVARATEMVSGAWADLDADAADRRYLDPGSAA